MDLYKVRHHGSRNATPKTLWNNCGRRGDNKGVVDRLSTVVATMPGKHGRKKNHSEVPRGTLVEALTGASDYHTTESAADRRELYIDIEVKLAK